MGKKSFLLLFFIIFNAASDAQDLSVLDKLVENHAQSKTFRNAQWSIYAKYADDDKFILDYNSDQSLAPASGLKVLTSGTALEILGEDFQYSTDVFYKGIIDNSGNLNGDIYLVGSGDPSLGSYMVEGALRYDEVLNRIVNAVKATGISKIAGSVIADNSLFDELPIPNNWEYIDIGNYYGASSSALTINDNLYYLYFKPAQKVGDIAEVIKTEPVIPGLVFTNYMKTGREGSGDNGYIYCAPLTYNAILRGTVPKGKNEFPIKGSIPDPPLFFAQSLQNKLMQNEIEVSNKPGMVNHKQDYAGAVKIVSIESPPLKSIIYILNKRSSNLYAELLLKMIALKIKGTGSTVTGVKVVEEFVKSLGINTEALNLYDGSGLSRANCISTKIMVEFLTEIMKKKWFESFYNSLALVGDPDDIGYFSNTGLGTAIAKNARIKSGVIQGVRSYSGYLNDKNGKKIVFSMIANNFSGSAYNVTKAHQEIMIELANLK
ncbi:MAG: D-alanyl-D-alanine carboxypeptidase/D-alanyl-D-alanine-endopeptidase [Melioribacteraceae bacterium]|nr:D-alanyl-D-alanine carboxypeptidase/D-alanyl-D-alanine-endopeptidase [Melioribacteraceae bacterium]